MYQSPQWWHYNEDKMWRFASEVDSTCPRRQALLCECSLLWHTTCRNICNFAFMREKCKRCLVPRRDPKIVQLFAEKKTQTGATFKALLHEVEAHLKVTRRALKLPVYARAIMLMEWGTCHITGVLEQPEKEEYGCTPGC